MVSPMPRLRAASNRFWTDGMIEVAASWGYHDLPRLDAENPTHLIHHIDQFIPLIGSLS